MSIFASLLCVLNIHTVLCRRRNYRSKWLALFYAFAVLNLASRTVLYLVDYASAGRCSITAAVPRAAAIPD